MFELEKSSMFFEALAAEHPTIVQNMEIVHENKLLLDTSYHNPKLFILHLNNLLRSLLFFVEQSIKNSPEWLKKTVTEYREDKNHEYEILKYLRNVSAHQKLIFPDESLIVGLFRIRSETQYLLKLGHGDHNKPTKYSSDFAFRNTEDIFHDILVFPSIAFMDLEHTAFGECLGITRKWFFKIKFKNNTTRFNEIVDVYSLICSFTSELLDRACHSYSVFKGIPFEEAFHYRLSDHNFINTILEIDLFPSLFADWWEEKMEPLNFGVLATRSDGDRYWKVDYFHKKAYGKLCNSAAVYKSLLEKYQKLLPDEFFARENEDEFISFVTLNHWHCKKAFNASLMNTPISPSEIMNLQRLGKVFINEHKKHPNCASTACEQFKNHLQVLAQKVNEL